MAFTSKLDKRLASRASPRRRGGLQQDSLRDARGGGVAGAAAAVASPRPWGLIGAHDPPMRACEKFGSLDERALRLRAKEVVEKSRADRKA
jgi:hypothetical protein